MFDGIDIDWEYPNACGLSCDTSGFASFKNLMQALRTRFGSGNLVTAAITADGTNGGKIDAADYGGAAQYLDWYNVMTYDYFGAFAAQGPTAPHSPLTSYAGIPQAGFYSDAAIQKLKSKGVPASQAAARHRLLRPGLDRRHPGDPRRHRHRRGARHLRGGQRGLQGPQEHLPADRHHRGHRLRQVRQQLVELRHPGRPSPAR